MATVDHAVKALRDALLDSGAAERAALLETVCLAVYAHARGRGQGLSLSDDAERQSLSPIVDRVREHAEMFNRGADAIDLWD